MARNIVPRTDKGADLGTTEKRWNRVYADAVIATNVQGGNLGAVEQSAGTEAALRSIITNTGSNPVTITIYDDIPIVATDLIIPPNVHLNFKDNGKLSPADGITLTVRGSVSAGLWQVFGGSGTLAGPIMNDMIFPEWFGNDLSRTIDVAGSHNTTIKISSPITINTDITIPNNIELDFARNGRLIADTGVTITLNCGIRTGPWQIFDGDGIFNGTPLVDTIYPEWWGAVGDGVADDTAALQAAADFCFKANDESIMLKTLNKTYRITSTLQIRCHADMSLSKINSDATFSPSIKVGDDNDYTWRLYFKGPDLLNTTKTGVGWGSTQVPYSEAIGIQAINLYECDFTNTRVQNFCIGLQIAAMGRGNCYNTYRLGTLANNQKNLQLKPLDYNSWCNENYFEGGRLDFFSSETDNTNTRQIEILSDGTVSTSNGNTFVRASLESDFCQYKLFLEGDYNTFIGCRWEGTSTNIAFSGPGSRFAQHNVFIGGFVLHNILYNNSYVELGNGQRYTTIIGSIYQFASIAPNQQYALRFYSNSFCPENDNVLSLGYPSKRFETVYAATSTINTSDAREKTELMPIETAERNVALKIKPMIGKFKFLDAINKKGEDNARIHFGTTAQAIAQAFESEGLDPSKYGMFCYDEWEADPENKVEAGSRYGIRYDELLAFLIAAL